MHFRATYYYTFAYTFRSQFPLGKHGARTLWRLLVVKTILAFRPLFYGVCCDRVHVEGTESTGGAFMAGIEGRKNFRILGAKWLTLYASGV